MKQPTQIQAKWNNWKNLQKREQPITTAVNLNTTYNILTHNQKHHKVSWNNENQDKLWNDITHSKQVKTSESNQKNNFKPIKTTYKILHQAKQHELWKTSLRTLATSRCPAQTWNKLNNRDDLSNQKLSETTETNLKEPETNGTTETTHNNLLSVATTYNNLKRTRPDQTTRSKQKQSQATSRTQHILNKLDQGKTVWEELVTIQEHLELKQHKTTQFKPPYYNSNNQKTI